MHLLPWLEDKGRRARLKWCERVRRRRRRRLQECFWAEGMGWRDGVRMEMVVLGMRKRTSEGRFMDEVKDDMLILEVTEVRILKRCTDSVTV